MLIGAVFPQTEIGSDPARIRDWAQAIQEMGYRHILAYDHVLGASTANRPHWNGPYTSETLFHEIMVLFGYLAAITREVELVSGILILPQRQTALVAKQAAEIDVLTGGRLRLGIGVGWNDVEYIGLNEDYHNRGKQSEEQIEVLRALWTEPVVTYHGKWHTIVEAGIKPLPVQRPIPIWIGGYADPVIERTGRLADGWFPQFGPNDRTRASIDRLHAVAREAGRDPASIGISGRLNVGQTPEAEWARAVESWRGLGASHLDVNTMSAGLTSPQAHIEVLRRVKETIGV